MSVLALILLCVSGVHSDSHSLRYYSIGISAPGYGLPEASLVGYVDDQKTEIYTSDTGRRVPVAPWVKRNVGREQWERSTNISKEYEALFKHEVKITMKRFNHTAGFHYVQMMHGCELRDDGSTAGYQQYRYNGREYMYLDMQTATFIPTMAEAQITTQRWNSPDVRRGEREKNDLENICIDRLKRYLEYGRKDLERRVRPGVKVTGRESGGVLKLHCLVYGFYPQYVDVKWMKNGMDEVPLYESTHVLPNPDGTYQIRVAVEVMPQEGESYSCYVEHSSLEEPLLVKWKPPPASPLTVIIIVGIIMVLLVTSVTTGVIKYRSYVSCSSTEKKKNNYTSVNTLPATSTPVMS